MSVRVACWHLNKLPYHGVTVAVMYQRGSRQSSTWTLVRLSSVTDHGLRTKPRASYYSSERLGAVDKDPHPSPDDRSAKKSSQVPSPRTTYSVAPSVSSALSSPQMADVGDVGWH